jgi:cytochrome c-type biogenesis protein CcmH
MRYLLAVLALAFAAAAFGQAEEVAHPDPRVEQRLKELGEQLRCLVCQNQTIAESNAGLALDLRNQIRAQVAAGKSDDEIRAYMVARYGDFVLYKPPFKATTALLWVGPFALLGVGIAAIAWIVLRRKRGAAPRAVMESDDAGAALAALLESEGPEGKPEKRG